MAEDLVRYAIRQRIQDGRLPRDRTIKLWHALGLGQICDACSGVITSTEWMYLICSDDWWGIRLHEECYVLWENERRTIA